MSKQPASATAGPEALACGSSYASVLAKCRSMERITSFTLSKLSRIKASKAALN